jgi:mannose-6-phosphate isomerase-like protein (cupin superfamily)
MSPTVAAEVVPAGAREVWWLDSTVDVKLTAAMTGGQVGVWVWHGKRGAAAPLHVHSREDEQFLVLDGAARFVCGNDIYDLTPGDAINLPRGIPHAYVLTADARLVGSATPGGFEKFFTDLGVAVVPGEPAHPGPAISDLAAYCPQIGVEILGPPPALD